jgi:hypothetical protein
MRAAGRGAFSQLGDFFASARGTSFHGTRFRATIFSCAILRTEFRDAKIHNPKISQAASETS